MEKQVDEGLLGVRVEVVWYMVNDCCSDLGVGFALEVGSIVAA